MRSAIKTVPAANSDHVTARAVGPSPEAAMMKRMYGLRKIQDTQPGREQATVGLTFEANDKLLHTQKLRMPSLKPSGTSQAGNPGLMVVELFVSSQRREIHPTLRTFMLDGSIFRWKVTVILSDQCTDERSFGMGKIT